MIPRLFCDIPPSGGKVAATAEQSHYLSKVLRLNLGDAVELFDGKGLRFQAKIAAVHGKFVHLDAVKGELVQAPRPHPIQILQGLPSGDKMDWIIEKAVELGVVRFSPMACERSIVNLSGPRLDKKMAHWQAEIEAACMQSRRDDLMVLDQVQTSARCLESQEPTAPKFLLDPGSKLGLLEALRLERELLSLSVNSTASRPNIVLAVGPESGFSDREREQAERAGYIPVSLGEQILRTETAALVGTAKLQAWLEMMSAELSRPK
jgi:16S rRNA (uracil1498-N3)-methyltransferase